MFKLNQYKNFKIKISTVVLMLYTVNVNAAYLCRSVMQASDINNYLAFSAHSKKAQKNNHKEGAYFKREFLLEKLRKNFNFKAQFNEIQHSRDIQKHLKKLNQLKHRFIKAKTLANPHLHYILEQIEKRKLPGELALLPMLESGFQPHAISNRGAVGLWQFMPDTGKQFGLKQYAGYDDRKDVKASTKAALAYLEYLYKKFNDDWMLALAAYNAGEGTVERAIKRNKNAGKPTSFWFLKLPKQTREYVAKFLALTQVIH